MSVVPIRWDPARAARTSELEQLVYRSNLLGADPRITSSGGGSTSAKLVLDDPLDGGLVRVLQVKGSGGDLGSIRADGFAALELDKLLALEQRFRAHEDELVPLVELCAFARSARPPDVDAALHAFVPYTHVDHVHPDAVLALACSHDGARLVREVFGKDVGWLDWLQPGFELALRVRDQIEKAPEQIGIVLGGRGLLVFGETSEGCYRNTVELVNRARAWLEPRLSDERAFGAVARPAPAQPERDARAAALLPALRGKLSRRRRVVARFDDSPELLAFVSGARLEELAARGAACPDHLLCTRLRPLVLEAGADVDVALARYRADDESHYARCRRPNSPPPRDPEPAIVLVPGLGLFAFGADATAARSAAERYASAVAVLRGAESVDRCVSLSEQDAFDVEYRALDEAKLRRRPAPPPLAGRVAYVTGDADGIGRATAARLLSEGACVALADGDVAALEAARAELATRFGADRVRALPADVTDEASVAASFARTVLGFGGVDVVVSIAGLAAPAPIAETPLALWRKSHEALATSSFLVAREAFRLFEAQGLGGSIVFVAGRNGPAATPGLALEGAPLGIRVNTVSPGAAVQGAPLGEDVAEAVLFFASERSRGSTGNVLNVDAV